MAIKGFWQVGKSQTQRLIRKARKSGLIALVVLITPFLLWLVIEAPRWQASQVSREPEKYFEVENKARSTILQALQAIGGAFFFVTAYVALKQLRVAEASRQLTEDKNLTDRFVKAAEMLADRERMEVRLGGIYTLERIARDSPNDHWTVMQLLIGFVEDRAKEPDAFDFLAKDITAALTAIGKRNVENDPKFVTRTGAQHLTKLELRASYLCFATLSWLNFDRAKLELVNLSSSQLVMVSLKYASIGDCAISQTWFFSGELTGAFFEKCNLSGSKFVETVVKDCRFSGCDLTGAVFMFADLSETQFFKKSNLLGTDFRLAEGLTEPMQVTEADNWKQAIYSPEFANKLPLTAEERAEMDRIRQKMALNIGVEMQSSRTWG
jgi:uncharacterized protein YjbI with pentapeptide repeats